MPFCLQSRKSACPAHETGLAIAVHYTNNVIRVSRATEFCLQLSESSFLHFSARWWVSGKQINSGEANWGGLACHWEKPYQAGSITDTFNNHQVIWRRLGTEIIHNFQSCLASWSSCLKSTGCLPSKKESRTQTVLTTDLLKKWDTLPFRCPASLQEMIPFPAVPQSPVHPWGTSGWMHRRAYLKETKWQQVKYTSWNNILEHRPTPNAAYGSKAN